jgi:hypothetical protein
MQRVMPPVPRFRPRIIGQRVTDTQSVDGHFDYIPVRPRLGPQRYLKASRNLLARRETIVKEFAHHRCRHHMSNQIADGQIRLFARPPLGSRF